MGEPGTGWFLDLCGPLTVTGSTGRAALRVPAGVPGAARQLIAAEALHQIACRTAARVRGVRRNVPAKVAGLRTHTEHHTTAGGDGTDGPFPGGDGTAALLLARVVRSGRLSVVETRLSVGGRTWYSATVSTQEVM
ncbi:hypothetical protein ABZ719_01345 [Streptomyces sp. NPDC006743]|uniref:hypothetical protein n=1 Tax=Streptomyces sp. NPDC006743 TaxID=3154480 RepID=UPI003451B595